MTARIPYQPEVDGLRAVAIVVVVLYHLGIPGLTGGFVGVDCFFVISGYLIFSLLYREQQGSGSIDWLAFYARRATRLLPEACVLIVAVLIAGWFILLPISPDLGRALAQHSLAESGVAAALWVTNFYFSVVGMGYFQPSIGREPFVHLWSLGVEEQFYLTVPFMFLLAGALSRAAVRAWAQAAAMLLALVFVVSLALAVWWSETRPWSAYYMLPTRAYEFAIGAGVALWLSRPNAAAQSLRAPRVLAVAGMVAILASSIGLRRDMAFPGAWALIPTVGTALVILACALGPANLVRTFLVNRGVAYVGKISYGWYLWHWPSIVFWKEYWLYDVTAWSVAAVAALSAVPAAIGYHLVARLRHRMAQDGAPSLRVLGLGAAGVAATVAACGALVWAAHTGAATPAGQLLNARLNDRWSAAPECIEPTAGPLAVLRECYFGDTSANVTVVLWGDSHALHWLPALDPLLKELRMRGLLRVYAGCPSGLSAPGSPTAHFQRCAQFNAATLEDIVARGRTESLIVLLFSRWPVYASDEPFSFIDRDMATPGLAPGFAAVESSLDRLVIRLNAADIPVGIAQPVPEQLYEVPNCLYRMPAERCGVSAESLNAYLRPAREMVDRVAAHPGVAVLDPSRVLCQRDVCPAQIGDKVLYVDDDHLSGEGAKYVGPVLKALLLKLAGSWPPEPPATARATALPPSAH